MEKLKITFSKQDKNRSVVSRGKAGGGGGIGVGIILLGGAVASAAAFLIRRRLRKSGSDSKNCNREREGSKTPSSEIPYKFLEDMNKCQGNDPPSVPPHASPYTTDADHNLSNGTARIGVQENDNIIPDQEYKVESNRGRGDSIPDAEDITHSIPPKGLVSIMQFDAFAIKEEESALADHLSREKFEMIQEHDSINTTLVDQGAQEEDKQMRENIDGEDIEINCWADEDMRKLNCQEDNAEPITTLQCGEEQESAFRCGQESESTGNLSICEEERLESEGSSLAFETVEVIQTNQTLDAARDIRDTMTQVTEIHGSLCTENFGVNNRNEKLEGSHEHLAEEENKCDHHDSSLNAGTDKEIKGSETIEATDEDEHKGAMFLMSQGQGKCLVDSLTTETVEVMEEVEMLEEAEGRDVKFVLVEVDNGAQHDKGVSSEESQATGEKAHFPDETAATGDQQKFQTEDGDREDNSVSDEITAQDSSYEDCLPTVPNMSLTVVDIPAQSKIAIDNGFTEVQLSAEANEARKENVPSETATSKEEVLESENLQMQLAENQQHINGGDNKQLEEVGDAFRVKYADNVSSEEHNLMRPVEDSLDNEGDDSADGHIAEKVEESSEGTGDSSMESNTEPIWPAESLEEVSMEHRELKIYEQKEEEQTEEDQTVKTQAPIYLEKIDNDDGITNNSIQKRNDQKGNSKLTFLKKAMLELEEQTHQPTYSRKLRILIPTLSVLSWAFCLWHFGPPFLKISLIIILIQVLSKIQGF